MLNFMPIYISVKKQLTYDQQEVHVSLKNIFRASLKRHLSIVF